MDRLEKAARALVDELDRMFEDGERGILFEREFRALRSALPPAPGGGEAGAREAGPVAWGVFLGPKCVNAYTTVDALREDYPVGREGLCYVAPLVKPHPTPAPLGGAEGGLERAVVDAMMAWIAANRAARTPPFMQYDQTEWTRLWNAMEDAYAALAAHRAARTA